MTIDRCSRRARRRSGPLLQFNPKSVIWPIVTAFWSRLEPPVINLFCLYYYLCSNYDFTRWNSPTKNVENIFKSRSRIITKIFFHGKNRLIVPVPIGKQFNFIRNTTSTDGYQTFINLTKGCNRVGIIWRRRRDKFSAVKSKNKDSE